MNVYWLVEQHLGNHLLVYLYRSHALLLYSLSQSVCLAVSGSDYRSTYVLDTGWTEDYRKYVLHLLKRT